MLKDLELLKKSYERMSKSDMAHVLGVSVRYLTAEVENLIEDKKLGSLTFELWRKKRLFSPRLFHKIEDLLW